MSPGIKSSELKLVLLCAVVMVLNGTEYVNVPWETLQWFIGLTGVYTGGRQIVKREGAKAIASPGEQRIPQP